MRHVMILAGGLSHERDVSLRSGRRVADALNRAGCETHVRDVDSSLLEVLSTTRPDVVWPVLHGSTGEDGALRDVLQTLGVAYVGARPASCRLTWDKPVAKALVTAAGVSAPAGVALSHATFRELGAAAVLKAVVQSLGLPLAVKPARGGSALGLSIVRSAEELPAAMVAAYAYGDIALLETFIEGTEVSVTVLEDEHGVPHALPAVEIVPDGGVYSYDARYTAGATEFFVPGRLSEDASLSGRRGRTDGLPRPGSPAPVPDGSHHRRRRAPLVPRGQHLTWYDRDLAGAVGDRGGRSGCLDGLRRPGGTRPEQRPRLATLGLILHSRSPAPFGGGRCAVRSGPQPC